jgi:hypothetical protein
LKYKILKENTPIASWSKNTNQIVLQRLNCCI